MRFCTVAILTWAALVFWERQEAQAISPSPVPNLADRIVAPMSAEASIRSTAIAQLPLAHTVEFPDIISTNAKDLLYTTNLDSQLAIPEKNDSSPIPNSQSPLVTDIQIRFVNNKGETVEGRTRKDFLLGELRLKPGQLFRQEALESDLRRLRRFEFVDRVNVSVNSDSTGVIIMYDIKESRFPSLSFGGGYNEDIGIYGTFGYRDANIGGLNQQLRGRLQVSAKDAQFDVQFTDPYRASEPNRLGYSVRAFRRRTFSRTFGDEIDLPNDDDAREGRFGGSVSVLRSFNDWDAALGLNYTRISIRDDNWRVSPLDELGNPLSLSGQGIDDLVTVSFAVTRDRRDRRLYPSTGSIFSLSTEQSIPIGLGDVLINRLRANYIQYVPVSLVGRGRPAQYPELTEMLAFNLQAGTILGEFPPAEAFNLGGTNSVRGYGGGGVGSGRSYGLASFEYRFPIVWRVGGVVFADFASDFGSGDTVLGEPGPIRDKPGSGFGYGLGLRVRSPFGLIRADFGISDRGDNSLEISFGQRF